VGVIEKQVDFSLILLLNAAVPNLLPAGQLQPVQEGAIGFPFFLIRFLKMHDFPDFLQIVHRAAGGKRSERLVFAQFESLPLSGELVLSQIGHAVEAVTWLRLAVGLLVEAQPFAVRTSLQKGDNLLDFGQPGSYQLLLLGAAAATGLLFVATHLPY
jgi:hypothetical protein